jgi:U3 small nucleolar RNA-associated protein 19
LDTETKRKIKKEPALAVEMKSDAFAINVSADDKQGDVISELWSFS